MIYVFILLTIDKYYFKIKLITTENSFNQNIPRANVTNDVPLLLNIKINLLFSIK